MHFWIEGGDLFNRGGEKSLFCLFSSPANEGMDQRQTR